VFLSYVAAHTERIALGTGSVITSFRHPLDVAKFASSVELISDSRLLFGAATGDRPIEFTAYREDRAERGKLFRESFHVMKEVWDQPYPEVPTQRANLRRASFIRQPQVKDIPVRVTGFCGQSLEWIAKNGNAWISLPRNREEQRKLVEIFRSLTD